jgi:type IV pilus assembly protein PilW
MFSGQTHACVPHTEAAAAGSDSFAIAYFTSDAMGLAAGLRADCARADVAADGSIARNTLRVGTRPLTPDEVEEGKQATARSDLGLPPEAPLLVINHYFLRPTTLAREGGGMVNTLALACRGNGSADKGAMSANELVKGVEQLVVTYGVRDPAAGLAGTSPHRYLTATEVGALAPMNLGDATLNGWQQVLSVRICLVVRSAESTAAGVAITDCEGKQMKLADGGQVQRFERVFSVKNRQGASSALSGGL